MNNQISASPGLTPKGPTSTIDILPQHPYMASSIVGPKMSTLEITVSTTAIQLHLPDHNHVIFDNQGLAVVQLSYDGATWFDIFTSGRAIVLDGHTDKDFWLQASSACVLLITTW